MPLIAISYSSVSCCRRCLRCANDSSPSLFTLNLKSAFSRGFSFRKLQIFHFANYRFSFRKLQILISQTTDFHFANYRFSFRKLQILISQTTDFHFANYRFSFRFVPLCFVSFVSLHFVSQTTVSPKFGIFMGIL